MPIDMIQITHPEMVAAVVCFMSSPRRVANKKYNTEQLNLNPIDKIKDKFDYYSSLFSKTPDHPSDKFVILKQDIATFFNLKPGINTKDAAKRIVRIS